ncbi:efflux RND transporter permease subunit [Halochromatium sp.]
MRNRHLLILVVILVLLAGLAAWGNLPRIEDPRITSRFAFVATPYPGAGAARVEALVTKPLEDAVREVAEVKLIDSTSSGDISVLGVELEDAVSATNNERIFAELRDKLSAAAANLPPGAGPPVLDSDRGATAYSLIAAVTWTADVDRPAPLGVLKRLAEELAQALRNRPGTEQVVLFGEPDEEIRVEVDPAELSASGLSVEQVAARLANADVKDPAGGLYGESHWLRLAVAGELDAAQRVAAVPLFAADGRMLSVGDIAQVSKTWREPPAQIAHTDGRRSLLIGVRTRAALDLDAWAASAIETVDGFSDANAGGGVDIRVLFDQSSYTQARLEELGGNLLAGVVVVMLVVFLTMGWRSALVVGSALPLSAAITLLGLDLFGQQIHQITIFGMIIAIGLLIDSAIVVADEVHQRLGEGATPQDAVRGTVEHLFTPLAASTFTTMLGFMPILLLPGNLGDFVGPIATAVIIALATSFLLSMSLIPALAALAGRGSGARHSQRCRVWWRDGLANRWLASLYARLLSTLFQQPGITALICLLLPAAGIWAATQLSLQFFPPSDRDQFEVQVWTSNDASITRTAAAMQALEKVIRERGQVRQLFWVAGASSPPVYYNQLRMEEDNPSYARATVQAASQAEARRLVTDLQHVLPQRFPDLRIVVRAFGQGPPIAAPISLRLFGPEPAQLRQLGDELRRILYQLPQVTETKASIPGGTPQLQLQANEQEALLAGLGLGDIARQYRAALDGVVGGSVLEDLEQLPVRVRWGDAERVDSAQLAALPLLSAGAGSGQGVGADTGAGTSAGRATTAGSGQPVWIPAAALGPLELIPEAPSITRRDGERVNIIEAWLTADALPIEVTAQLRTAIEREGLVLPAGYRLEFAGDSEEQGEAIALLLAYAPLLGAMMVATLVLAFRSFVLAGLILLIGALSVALGMLALWLSGYPLGFNPVLGSAGLIGVAINDSIVVLAAIRANARAAAGDLGAMVQSVLGSTRHVISTTLTTVGGFLPLILFSGGDFWPPLAIVIAGGVALATPLGLVFTPAAYQILLCTRLVRAPRPSA